MGQKVSEALEEIKKAQESGDAGTIGQYLADDRKTVKVAAESALASLAESGAEDNTPPLKEPEDAVNIQEAVEQMQEEADDLDSDGVVLTTLKNDNQANEAIRLNDWIDMTPEESLKYQKKGLLVGYNPKVEKGLLKK